MTNVCASISKLLAAAKPFVETKQACRLEKFAKSLQDHEITLLYHYDIELPQFMGHLMASPFMHNPTFRLGVEALGRIFQTPRPQFADQANKAINTIKAGKSVGDLSAKDHAAFRALSDSVNKMCGSGEENVDSIVARSPDLNPYAEIVSDALIQMAAALTEDVNQCLVGVPTAAPEWSDEL